MQDFRIDNILVPTDFSPCAENALDVALQLAEKFHAAVHLCHKIDLPERVQNLPVAQMVEHPRVQAQLDEAAGKLEEMKNLRPRRIKELVVWAENLTDEIAQYSEQNGIDLIVMGSHGAGGKNEFFIGSNTQKVVRAVHRPVLIIKEPLEDINFTKVVYASNFELSEKEPFLYFKSFIKHFLPKIYLVTIHAGSFLGVPVSLEIESLENFEALAAPLDCETHLLKGLSVDQSVRFFAEEVGADLIVISNHHRRPLRRMFLGSNVEALVNHSTLPVLSIDYPAEENHTNETS